jgi:16S rRNA (uracil1498-N3)-methyltransferase
VAVHRFYVPHAREESNVSLPREEAEHLRRVLRLRIGDAVVVFDGDGGEFPAVVASIDGSQVTVATGARGVAARELPTAIVLVQSVLKGDKMDEVVRDAVMLGVTAIQPLLSAHTEVASAAAAARVERWTRIAIASTKQCGRARLTTIGAPCSWTDWIRRSHDGLTIMLVEPRSDALPPVARELPSQAPDRASIVVGPEGGWTADEVREAAAAGATAFSLGDRTLRADRVPLVALSMLLYAWREK